MTGEDDREVLVKRGFGGGVDEDDDERDIGRGGSIPLVQVTGAMTTKDTAYEPFRHTGAGGH